MKLASVISKFRTPVLFTAIGFSAVIFCATYLTSSGPLIQRAASSLMLSLLGFLVIVSLDYLLGK